MAAITAVTKMIGSSNHTLFFMLHALSYSVLIALLGLKGHPPNKRQNGHVITEIKMEDGAVMCLILRNSSGFVL